MRQGVLEDEVAGQVVADGAEEQGLGAEAAQRVRHVAPHAAAGLHDLGPVRPAVRLQHTTGES